MIGSLIFDNYKKKLQEAYGKVDFKTHAGKLSMVKDATYFRDKLGNIEGAGNVGQIVWDYVNTLKAPEKVVVEKVVMEEVFDATKAAEEQEEKERKQKEEEEEKEKEKKKGEEEKEKDSKDEVKKGEEVRNDVQAVEADKKEENGSVDKLVESDQKTKEATKETSVSDQIEATEPESRKNSGESQNEGKSEKEEA